MAKGRASAADGSATRGAAPPASRQPSLRRRRQTLSSRGNDLIFRQKRLPKAAAAEIVAVIKLPTSCVEHSCTGSSALSTEAANRASERPQSEERYRCINLRCTRPTRTPVNDPGAMPTTSAPRSYRLQPWASNNRRTTGPGRSDDVLPETLLSQ